MTDRCVPAVDEINEFEEATVFAEQFYRQAEQRHPMMPKRTITAFALAEWNSLQRQAQQRSRAAESSEPEEVEAGNSLGATKPCKLVEVEVKKIYMDDSSRSVETSQLLEMEEATSDGLLTLPLMSFSRTPSSSAIQKRRRVLWRSCRPELAESIVSKGDVVRLQEVLQEVAFANVSPEDLQTVADEQILALIHLLQLGLEFILSMYSQSYQITEQLMGRVSELTTTKKRLKSRLLAVAGEGGAAAAYRPRGVPCGDCGKRFEDAHYLTEHVKRRHGAAAALPINEEAEAEKENAVVVQQQNGVGEELLLQCYTDLNAKVDQLMALKCEEPSAGAQTADAAPPMILSAAKPLVDRLTTESRRQALQLPFERTSRHASRRSMISQKMQLNLGELGEEIDRKLGMLDEKQKTATERHEEWIASNLQRAVSRAVRLAPVARRMSTERRENIIAEMQDMFKSVVTDSVLGKMLLENPTPKLTRRGSSKAVTEGELLRAVELVARNEKGEAGESLSSVEEVEERVEETPIPQGVSEGPPGTSFLVETPLEAGEGEEESLQRGSEEGSIGLRASPEGLVENAEAGESVTSTRVQSAVTALRPTAELRSLVESLPTRQRAGSLVQGALEGVVRGSGAGLPPRYATTSPRVAVVDELFTASLAALIAGRRGNQEGGGAAAPPPRDGEQSGRESEGKQERVEGAVSCGGSVIEIMPVSSPGSEEESEVLPIHQVVAERTSSRRRVEAVEVEGVLNSVEIPQPALHRRGPAAAEASLESIHLSGEDSRGFDDSRPHPEGSEDSQGPAGYIECCPPYTETFGPKEEGTAGGGNKRDIPQRLDA
ncbi:hypothetical protein FOZ60_014169 [Perkinsus olseni]|uniref:C2H2-type domain-containing protein n=1 Tax=Perkinsus olseni TaxID=32597 RepID=A0A7J6NAW5_PEROL|nr:hypothetical protein FOZ60_014169 [Perkinsus olseni]